MISVSTELLRSLADPEGCYFDHHGGCQAHGYLSLEPGEKCPQAEVQEILAALPEQAGRLTVYDKDELLDRLTPAVRHAYKAASNLRASTEGWEEFPASAPLELDADKLAQIRNHARALDQLAEELFDRLVSAYSAARKKRS